MKCTRKPCPVPVEKGHRLNFPKPHPYGILLSKEAAHTNPNTEKLRTPEGMTSEDIRRMSEDDLLDMDYFLNEDDLLDDEAGVEGFYIF